MKYIFILLIMVLITFVGIDLYYSRGYVEQEIRNDDSRIICKSGECLATFVWYDSRIVADWWDDIATVTDSIIKLRQENGERLIKRLDLMK